MGSKPEFFLSPYFHHCIVSVFITVKDCFQIQFLICTSPIWFYMYSKSSMGKIFALVYTTLLTIKLDFTHGYVLFLKIILSVFFLIEKTFELMTLHYSILQTCFRNELDPYFHNWILFLFLGLITHVHVLKWCIFFSKDGSVVNFMWSNTKHIFTMLLLGKFKKDFVQKKLLGANVYQNLSSDLNNK